MQGGARNSFSIIFPCFNDAATIGSLVAAAEGFARSFTEDFEIIVVDDGSTDQSLLLLEELKAHLPSLRIIGHPENRGYGGALRSGFAAATKDLVFYTDGDGQYDPSEFELLYRKLSPDVDVVNGFKIRRSDPLHRIMVGKIYQHGVRFGFALPIRDIDCDFRLIRRNVFAVIELEHDSGVICVEMIKKMQLAGCNFAEAAVNHYFRLHGKSQFFNFPRVARVLWDLGLLWCRLVAWQRMKPAFDRVLGSVTK